jgi:hypothetical protein
MRIALRFSLTFDTAKPVPESAPAPEQRDAAVDAMVIPADGREPRELDARHRPDSYGFFDDGQKIGFSRARRA